MDKLDINKMWEIDQKAQLGSNISEDEKIYFNSNFDKMVKEMESNFEHWKYHSNKI